MLYFEKKYSRFIFLPTVRKRYRRNDREQSYLFHLVAFFVIVPRIEPVVNVVNRKIPDETFSGILALDAVRKIEVVEIGHSSPLNFFSPSGFNRIF